MAARESLLYQVHEFKVEDKLDGFSMFHGLETYRKYKDVLGQDLTLPGSIFERDTVGLSKRDADKMHVLTGSKSIEEYLRRIVLNEASFRDIVTQVFGNEIKTRMLLEELS